MTLTKRSRPLARKKRITKRSAVSGPSSNTNSSAPGIPAAVAVMTHVASTADATAAQPSLGGGAGEAPAESEIQSALTEDLCRDIFEVVKHGVSEWCKLASFQGVLINGSNAIGAPGCLNGPNMRSMMMTAPKFHGQDPGVADEIMDACVRTVADCFGIWLQTVSVPNLVWYPTFQSYPGPMAPPTASIPCRISQLGSGITYFLTRSSDLKREILMSLPQDLENDAVDKFCEGVSKSLALGFETWFATHVVTNVMGTGPVPTFAPPHVMSGPVIGGSVLPTPGALDRSISFPFARYPIA